MITSSLSKVPQKLTEYVYNWPLVENIFSPPNVTFDAHLHENNYRSTILVGDTNAHSPMWGYQEILLLLFAPWRKKCCFKKHPILPRHTLLVIL